MTAFDDLGTEARDTAAADLELRSTLELVQLMSAADATVAPAVAVAAAAIAALVDDVAAKMAAGGRLIYAGAGTSGNLAALDAVECEPTFSVPVTAVVAPSEEAEDDRTGGARAIEALGVSEADAVVGISASGRSPWVVGALEAARSRGALTGCVTCVEASELSPLSDREVCVLVGAEVIAGSTRLKAGTAQKLVLNMLSTISMIRLGRTHGNLMVGVAPLNDKLRARQRSVVAQAAGASTDEAADALAAAGGDAKAAIRELIGKKQPQRRAVDPTRRRGRARRRTARPRRRRGRRRADRRLRTPLDKRTRDRLARLRRPPGQRLRRSRLPRRRHERLPRGRRGAARDRRHRVPAHADHGAGGAARRRAGRDPRGRQRPAHPRGARRGPLHLASAARGAPSSCSA